MWQRSSFKQALTQNSVSLCFESRNRDRSFVLFDQIRLPQWFQDAALELALVKSHFGLCTKRDVDLPDHIRQVRGGAPRRVKHVAVGRKGNLYDSLRLDWGRNLTDAWPLAAFWTHRRLLADTGILPALGTRLLWLCTVAR